MALIQEETQGKGRPSRIFVGLHAPPANLSRKQARKAQEQAGDRREGMSLPEGEYDIRFGTINHYLSHFYHLCLGRTEEGPAEKRYPRRYGPGRACPLETGVPPGLGREKKRGPSFISGISPPTRISSGRTSRSSVLFSSRARPAGRGRTIPRSPLFPLPGGRRSRKGGESRSPEAEGGRKLRDGEVSAVLRYSGKRLGDHSAAKPRREILLGRG